MSAIGGGICYGKSLSASELMLTMSRAMLLRGREQRGAYIREGGWLFHNRSSADGGAPWFRQPLTLKKEGHPYTVVLDGRIWGRGNLSGLSGDITSESDAMLALECYLAYGASFLKHLDGTFALAIWDERRGELILAVDQDGSRPLFYLQQGEEFFFSSEIKGLLRAMPSGAVIDRQRLHTHLTAPMGSVGGGDLYRGIGSLPAGHCMILSRMGAALFPYESEGEKSSETPKIAIPLEWYCPEEVGLREMMTEILFAFDYPQFDHWMPSLLHTMDRRKEKNLVVADEILHGDIGYARERADRLGQSRGRVLIPVCAETAVTKERELKQMDRRMRHLLEEADTAVLDHLYGADWRTASEREKNTAKRIRMLGILYQSVLWNQHYSLFLA